jgi:predicted ATPase/DNA-binding winged helix-turn-helix (wHTH) protein
MKSDHLWRFGSVDVDSSKHRMSRQGRIVPLTPKAFAVLVALLRRPGELVTKSELFDAVWPGVVVTDSSLSRAIREVRAALDDNASQPRFVETVHGLGFRFISPVAEHGRPGPTVGDPEAGHRLTGRDVDLERLDGALGAADTGRRQVLFVTGEAGIGKTALVEAFAERHATRDDVAIVQGRCIEQYGTGEAHLPILEALEQLARDVGSETFVETFARYAPTWLTTLPWLVKEVAPTAREAAAAATTHQRMLRELAHALDVLAHRRTIVLWLEDLHWSDPSSLEVVAFLAGRRDPSRLLLIGSFRPAEATGAASVLHNIALRLVQRGQADEMSLRPLAAADVAKYLRARFQDASGFPVDALAEFIHRRTDGNALFVVSIIDDLLRRGELVQVDGDWRLSRGLAELDHRLPDTLRRLVDEQAERLSEEDRRLVEAAAVVGPTFAAVAVAAALEADPTAIEDRCMRLAMNRRLIEPQPPVSWPDGTISSGFRFIHVLYWQGVRQRVPQGRWATWQRLVGIRQEEGYGAQCVGIASELAMRFEVAHDFERSLRYRRMAGAAALSRCAYPECIEQLRGGLSLVPSLPPAEQARHELDLLLPLGPALMALQGYASAEVEALYDRALALCRSCGEPEDLLRALRGQWNVAFLRSDLAGARGTAETLLARADSLHDPRMQVDAHSKMGWTLLHQGDLPGARLHLQTALDASASTGVRAVVREAPRVAAYLAWSLWYGGQPDPAARMGDRALELARHADSPHSSAFALGYVSWLRLMRGEIALARTLAAQQLALALEYGLAYWRQLAEFIAGATLAQEGRVADGISAMRRAIDDMQGSGGRVGVPYLLCILGEAHLSAGQTVPANDAVVAASALIASSGNALYAAEALRLQALVARAADDSPLSRETARRGLRTAIDVARNQGARALELRAATCLARDLDDGGDPQGALQVLAPVRAAFADGPETADLRRADGLLASLGKRVARPRSPPRARRTSSR